ncbi:hypothetical protein WMY93_024642 [Mugilogobius chulae]|uniref:AATF leucine zipper-containing domain-containing protein n=1 Tax=Mugilogobius chulae TaxID=88201 RepID=A0AAW0N4Q3_9GOBI
MSGSFSQQLEDLLNPQPKFIDPEDDGDEETKARVIDKFDEDDDEEGRMESGERELMREMEGSEEEEDEDEEEEDAGDGEDDNDEDDEDDDVKDDDEEEPEDELQETDEENDLNDDGDDLNNSEVTFPKGVDFRKLTEGMDDLGVSEEEDDDDEEDEEDEAESGDSEEEISSEEDDMEQDSGVQTFSQDKINDEVEKGQAVKNQLALWDQLLEGRIKKSADFAGALKNSHKALKALQRSLLELHDELLGQNADTRTIVLAEQSDEEIESDEGESADGRIKSQKRKLDMSEYPAVMAKRFSSFAPYRNATLQKWHDKTRLTTGKTSKAFGAFERNVLTQIEQVLTIKKD